MSIYRRFPSRSQPSFITANTHKWAKLFSAAKPCELLISIIYQIRGELQFMLLAFAIMPDHFHLVVLPPDNGPAKMMQLIKGRFARSYNLQAARDGPVWQSRYHERILTTEKATFSAIEYVHSNPVVARLSELPEKYQWSSAHERWQNDLGRFFGQAEA